jgi:hypothetical protein
MMKVFGLVFAIFLICVSAHPSENGLDEEKRIKEAKEKLAVREIKTKMQALGLIGEIGAGKFVKAYPSEKEQKELLTQITTGSSTVPGSMVRADVLTELLDSKFASVRVGAAEGLVRYAIYTDQPHTGRKLVSLMDSKDPELRLAAVKAIDTIMKKQAVGERKNLKKSDIIEEMVKHYDDDNADVLFHVIRLFPRTENKQVIEKVKKLVVHPNQKVRRRSFAFFADNEIVDEEVRKAALKTLGEGEESLESQIAASRYLGTIGEKEGVPAMIQLMDRYAGPERSAEGHWVTVFKATTLRALAQLATEQALECCIGFVQSDEPLQLIEEAGLAIQTITGKEFGYDKALVPSQKKIAEKRFRVWYIRDHLKQGDERKKELSELETEIQKLSEELLPVIIVEKIAYTERESAKPYSQRIPEAGTERVAEAGLQTREPAIFINRLMYYGTRDESFNNNILEIALHFLDEDEKLQIAAMDALMFGPYPADYTDVMAKLEEIGNDQKSKLRGHAQRATMMLRRKYPVDRKKPSEPDAPEKSKGKNPPKQ